MNPPYFGSKHLLGNESKFILITQGEDETAEEKEEGIEGILSDVLDDENGICWNKYHKTEKMTKLDFGQNEKISETYMSLTFHGNPWFMIKKSLRIEMKKGLMDYLLTSVSIKVRLLDS